MNKPLQKLRRFFTRTKKFNATANPDALSAAYDDDDGASRLSGAFVVVLLLHIVALVGVFAFARIKDSRAQSKPATTPIAQAAAPTATPANTPRTGAPKPQAPAAQAAPVVAPQATISAPAVTAAALVHSDTKPVSIEPRPAAKGDRTHIVKANENLTKIGAFHGVTVAELVKANNFKSENEVLHAGQELKIPEPGKTAAKAPLDPKAKPAEEKAAPGTYIVRKNDSLIKIASTLGVKYEEIVKLNNIKDPKKLQEGQKLKVPKKG